jgi:DNA gyrase/topoisomerase IV subunit A
VIAPDPAGLQALEALSGALGDPHRLVDVLHSAADDEDALRRLAEAFELTDVQAQVVLDNRFGLLTPTRRAELAEELQAERRRGS